MINNKKNNLRLESEFFETDWMERLEKEKLLEIETAKLKRALEKTPASINDKNDKSKSTISCSSWC